MVRTSVDLDAGPQPGGRRPAPGALGLVQAFVNTHYDLGEDHGAERLRRAEDLRDWLAGRGLLAVDGGVDAADLERALALREGLRELALANNGHGSNPGALDRLGAVAPTLPLAARLGAAGARLEGRGEGVDAALAAIVAAVAEAMLDGSWGQLKACPGDDCGWAFYDHSRNRSGRWCSMSVCGSRAKARAYYHRRRG
jgi:predicted RNA-binding Zn ribbon-like protein